MEEAARRFGSQSVAGAIDYRGQGPGGTCVSHGATRARDVDLATHARRLVDAGAGEILLYAVDRDGMQTGYDLEAVRTLAASLPVPVVSCGGARGLDDLRLGLEAGASAVAAGHIFVYVGRLDAVLISYPDPETLEDALGDAAVTVR